MEMINTGGGCMVMAHTLDNGWCVGVNEEWLTIQDHDVWNCTKECCEMGVTGEHELLAVEIDLGSVWYKTVYDHLAADNLEHLMPAVLDTYFGYTKYYKDWSVRATAEEDHYCIMYTDDPRYFRISIDLVTAEAKYWEFNRYIPFSNMFADEHAETLTTMDIDGMHSKIKHDVVDTINNDCMVNHAVRSELVAQVNYSAQQEFARTVTIKYAGSDTAIVVNLSDELRSAIYKAACDTLVKYENETFSKAVLAAASDK